MIERISEGTDRVGFTGNALVGKSTYADALVQGHSFTKLSLAKPVKIIGDAVCDMEGLSPEKSVRRPYYQKVGEAGRVADPMMWIRQMVEKYHLDNVDLTETGSRYVVDDIRFENEAEYLRDICGFTIVKIEADMDVRIARGKANDPFFTAAMYDHDSEQHINNIVADLTLTNNTEEDRIANLKRLNTLVAYELAA